MDNTAHINNQAFIAVFDTTGYFSGEEMFLYDKETEKFVKSDLPQEEVRAEFDRLYSKDQALNNRVNSYPSVTDQLDMLFHELRETGTISSSGNWYNLIEEVKTNNPL